MTDSSSSAPANGVRHVDALPVGTRLGEFEVLALLGVGGFGMVYKAFDHSLHRAVAIKEFMPAALVARAADGSLQVRSPADQSAFLAGLSSFVGEARLLAQFDHPSLVKVFRFWETNSTAYMVMPLYSGMTFKQARAQMRTPPPEEWLRKVLWSVLGALRVLHGGHTLHRDISPDNIFLQDVGPPVLLDLGAARHAINDRDRKHTAVLKVNYAPIEQYSDGDAELIQGPWSDLYSLAAVVHGCLCNDTPLPSTLRAIRDRMVSFSRVARTVKRQFGQDYSPAFVAAISQSLALRPQDRPQSIDAFLQLMDMASAPAGLEHFDFRAELGDLWVEPTDQPGPGLVVPTVDVTSAVMGSPTGSGPVSVPVPVGKALPGVAAAPVAPPAVDPLQKTQAFEAGADVEAGDTVFLDAGDTVFLDAGDTVVMEDMLDSTFVDPHAQAPTPAPKGRERAAESRPVPSPSHRAVARAAKASPRGLGVAWLAVGGAAFVVAAAAGVYGWRSRAPVPPVDPIITELAEPASAPAALVAVASRPEPVASEASAAPAAASATADALPVAAPAFVAASGAKPTPKQRRPAAAITPTAVVEPAPAAPPPPPEPPPVVAVPRPAPPPVRLCENTSVLTRSMCLREECRKPAHASLAACVEYRQRMEPLEKHQLAN